MSFEEALRLFYQFYFLKIELNDQEKINTNIIIYLNRLSDYLFMLARKLSKDLSIEEIKWIPEKK